MNKSTAVLPRPVSFIFLCIFFSVFFLRPIETEDIWWHLSAGRHVVTHQAVPHEDPFALSGQKIPWTFTQWLGSSLLHAIYQGGGNDGLRYARVFIFLLTFLIFVLYARKKIPSTWLIFLMFIMSFGLGARTQLRPDLLNLLFIPVLLILLDGYYFRKKTRWLLFVPLLGVVWSNIHLGSFVYGNIILGIFVLASWLDFIQYSLRLKKNPQNTDDAIPTRLKHLLLCHLGYLLSFLINPYGWRGAVYPLRVFFDPQFIQFYRFNAFITEQQPPTYLLSLNGTWFFILLLLLIYAFARNRNRNLVDGLLFGVGLFLYLYSHRGVHFFTLISGYVIVKNLGQVFLAKKNSSENIPRSSEISWCRIFETRYKSSKTGWVFLGLIVLLGIHIVHTVNKGAFKNEKWQRGVFVAESFFTPQRSLKIIRQLGWKGLVFNSDRYGGYLIWHDYPQLIPFVDGRQLNRPAWRIYRDVISNPEAFWPGADAQFDFQLALIDASTGFNQRILHYLLADPSWQFIDVDGFSVLFAKKGNIQLPQQVQNYRVNLQQMRYDPEKVARLLQRPTENRGLEKRIEEFLFPPPFYVDAVQEGITLFDLGFEDAGISRVAQAMNFNPSIKANDILRFMVEKKKNE